MKDRQKSPYLKGVSGLPLEGSFWLWPRIFLICLPIYFLLPSSFSPLSFAAEEETRSEAVSDLPAPTGPEDAQKQAVELKQKRPLLGARFSDPSTAKKPPVSARPEEKADSSSEPKKLVLKVMVVNPSTKHAQKYPIKAYLPEEVLPQHILAKEDLQVAFDSTKGAYYLTQEVLLDPGKSVVKTIEVEDIWLVPENRLQELSKEAAMLMSRVEDSPYEEKARLLVSNTEVLLTQIYESQNDLKLTPEEHIALFRENKKKIEEIELDLVALRRLVFQATGDSSVLKLGAGESAVGFLGAGFKPELISRNLKGAIPAWVAWRVIFMILGLLALATGVFYGIWAQQMKKLDRKKSEESEKTPLQPKGFKDLVETSGEDEEDQGGSPRGPILIPRPETPKPGEDRAAAS